MDEKDGKALFAAFPAGADMPFTPGSAFDPGKTIEDGQDDTVELVFPEKPEGRACIR